MFTKLLHELILTKTPYCWSYKANKFSTEKRNVHFVIRYDSDVFLDNSHQNLLELSSTIISISSTPKVSEFTLILNRGTCPRLIFQNLYY